MESVTSCGSQRRTMPGAVRGAGRAGRDTPYSIDREVRRLRGVASAAGSCRETQPTPDDGSSNPSAERIGNIQEQAINNETSDILVCGTCRQLFTTVVLMRKHKSGGCRKKVVCRCTAGGLRMRRGESNDRDQEMPRRWLCRECWEEFDGPWHLMHHAGAVHDNVIYRRDQRNQQDASVSS
ncbi:uncharacterized protein LOC144863485 [Branchiostoma floridae x Branchiostoma japonicum]